MTIKKALITGIAGQDGAFLSKLLLEKNYKVYGIVRSKSKNNLWRLEKLKIKKKIKLIKINLSNFKVVWKLIFIKFYAIIFYKIFRFDFSYHIFLYKLSYLL